MLLSNAAPGQQRAHYASRCHPGSAFHAPTESCHRDAVPSESAEKGGDPPRSRGETEGAASLQLSLAPPPGVRAQRAASFVAVPPGSLPRREGQRSERCRGDVRAAAVTVRDGVTCSVPAGPRVDSGH